MPAPISTQAPCNFNCLGRYYTDGPRKNHVLLVHITVLSYLRATADSTGDFGEAWSALREAKKKENQWPALLEEEKK